MGREGRANTVVLLGGFALAVAALVRRDLGMFVVAAVIVLAVLLLVFPAREHSA
jgi:hypothetical protein